MNNKDLKKEILDPSEERVAALLARLPKADPPGDFEVRVKAAIARRKSDGAPARGWSWRPIAAFASVAMIAAVWGGLALYNSDDQVASVAVNTVEPQAIQAPPAEVAQVVQSAPIVPIAESNEAVASSNIVSTPVSNSNIRTNSNATVARNERSPIRNTAIVRPANSEADGGSYDEAVTAANRLDTSSPAERKVSSLDMLRRAGVSGSMSGGQFVVGGVSGAASAAGLRSGDVVLAVNGVAVSSADAFNENVRLRSVTVQRDGSRIVINFAR